MDSYLANIDNYMKEHEEEMLLTENPQPQQQAASDASPSSSNLTNDEWVLRSPSNTSSSSFFNNMESLLNQDTQLFIPNVQLGYVPTNYTQPLNSWINATNNHNNNSDTQFQPSLLNIQQQQPQQQQPSPPPQQQYRQQHIIIPPLPELSSQQQQPQQKQQQKQQQQQQLNVPQRRKPGRKPNPAAPQLRKAQNRAAQRAFRERKEKHVSDLEDKIKVLQEKNDKLSSDLYSQQLDLEAYKAETWYLKGVVLTLQFICMHHNIKIPGHNPYLKEKELAKIAKNAPHTIAAYTKAYSNNNRNLKNSLAYHYIHSHKRNKTKPADDEASMATDPSSLDHTTPTSFGQTPQSSIDDDIDMSENENEDEDDDNAKPDQWWNEITKDDLPGELPAHSNLKSSLRAIQEIRNKLGVPTSALFSTNDKSAARLRPTLLQLAIPHDPRIDLIPMAHMRDRMILFRSQMDYDRCFSLMIDKGVFHGGDPTLSKNWEMPSEFFSEFWYLAIDYDLERTNRWRRRQGLRNIEAGPVTNSESDDETEDLGMESTRQKIEDFHKDPTEAKLVELWELDMWTQVLKDLPELEHDMITKSQKAIYESLKAAPDIRPRLEDPPTLGDG